MSFSYIPYYNRMGRRRDIMFSALDSGTQAEGQCIVFLARQFTLRVPLSTQMY